LELQKAFLWKRVAAGVLDLILTSVVAVGFALLLSYLLGYDNYSKTMNDAYAKYEAEYGIDFNITEESYTALSEEEKKAYDDAQQALVNDEPVMKAYNMMLTLSVLITTFGILLGVMLVEFAVPLLFGNGQTLGKKVFGIGLVRQDSVKISTLQLFVRTLLGKYTIETMVPVFILLMMFWGTIGIIGPVVIIGILAAEVICIFVSQTVSLIHDALAGTVAVDLTSQRVFESEEALIEYKKKLHAEQAAKQAY